MLRQRILVILALGLALLTAALYWTATQRDRLIESQVSALAALGQRAVWQERAGLETRTLATFAEEIAASAPLTAALMAGDRDAVARAVATDLAAISARTNAFEIVDPTGRQIFTEAERVDGARLLDLRTLGDVIEGRTVTGLRQDRQDRFLILHAFPLTLPDGRRVAVTIGDDAMPVLRDFAIALDAPAFLVNPRGRAVAGTQPGLWDEVGPEIPLRRPDFALLEHAGRRYVLVSVPVADLAGGQAAVVATLRESTASLSELVRQRRLTLIGVGLGIVALLGGMYLYLRRAFRPLDRAIDVLDALARGDTSVRMEVGGQAEIGRIAAAVGRFRSHLIELGDLRMQADRRTRRQERLIRARMKDLAGSLDETARAEIVALLEQETPVAAGGAPADLALLANVLQLLSRRITEQNQRLNAMIEDLREAIVTRARLAGITQELEIARQLQASLLPDSFPEIPGFQVAAAMKPARDVGGDFYDFFRVGPDRYVLVVGDVSGKGVPAALFMAVVRTLVRAATRYEPDPARCIGIVNEILAEENEQMMFVTMFYAVLDAAERRITYVNAGHNAPLLVGPGPRARFLPVTGDMAAAVMDGFVYRSRSETMRVGETLLVYTDGMTEAFDPDGLIFGDERMRDLAASVDDGRPLLAMTDGLLAGLAAFVRGAQQSDDITFLALRCREVADLAASGTVAE